MSRAAELSEVDYIILGAGSAGCVLANRLSEDGANTVAILEAGPMDNKLMIHIPAGVYHAFKDPSINWNYRSEPQPDCDGRSIELPRGKVIGGSSSINSMVYMRGHPRDYDRWDDELGLNDWRYADCLPYFKRCESYDGGADDYRGDSGPLGVSRSSLDNPLLDVMMLAGEQSGQGTSKDLNGFKPEGIARLDSTKKNGRRSSAAVAHLKPALTRPNLSLSTGAMVDRVQIENGRAVGVEYRVKGQSKTLRAGKEVILSCGAIKSPQVLMLSGIGSGDYLGSMDIDPVHHLPGVGQNLQDHLYIAVGFECRKDVTLHKLTNPLRKLAVGTQWLATRKGLGASNVWEMGGLVKSDDAVEYPNLQYHFAPVYAEYEGRKINLKQGFTLHVDQLRPASHGSVRLHSKNPDDRPAADFRYLSDSRDLDELVDGFGKMQDLLHQPAFDEFRGARIAPAPDVSSASEIREFVRASVSTDYHPSGTCAMGIDDTAVVDGEMRVRGIKGLRVVDASVMPKIVSGNLNAPTQMLAERAADFILGKPQLAPLHTRFHFSDPTGVSGQRTGEI